MSPLVTLGVPGYRGERFMAESLDSIRAQTCPDFEVLISLDGPQPSLEEVCRPFLDDPRFRLVVQPERLGWVGNINWLMDHTTTPYWVYQQQDAVRARRQGGVEVDHVGQVGRLDPPGEPGVNHDRPPEVGQFVEDPPQVPVPDEPAGGHRRPQFGLQLGGSHGLSGS